LYLASGNNLPNVLLLQIDWTYIFQHPNDNGITIFISGFLLTLSLYHFLLYFQHKDRSYLYYSLYTFLIFVYTYHRAHFFFLRDFSLPLKPYLYHFSVPLQWLFNTIYLLFVKTFIDLKQYKPQWNRFLNYSIGIYLSILILLMLYTSIIGNQRLLGMAYAFFFLPTITIIAVITMYILYTMDTVLKYYVLSGSIIYLLLSLTAFYLSFLGHLVTTLFYIATFFENIFFALGLGAKQKKILMDKNTAQEKVIEEHQQNIALQQKVHSKLDKEVALKTAEILRLNQEKEKEKRTKLAIEFSKKTLNLRMRALQTQMNPHFLFNSLNSVKYYIIQNKKEDAAYFLSKLSKLLRKILDNSQLQEISLKEELAVMQIYIEVENMRMENEITLILPTLKPTTERIKLPPLVLQPFIENAIWHGLALKKGKKLIQIEIQSNKDYLSICIADNGIGRERAAINKAAKLTKKESLGISLTKERLEVSTTHLQNKVKIRFEDLYTKEKPAGTKVYINIPLR